SADPYIILTDNTAAFGNIDSNTTKTINDAYTLNISDGISDQHAVQFGVEVTDGNDTWNSSFTMICNAPDISLDFNGVDDSAGDDNGRIDPGETVALNLSALNNGHSATCVSYCLMDVSSPYITVLSDSASTGTINAAGNAPASFGISVDAGTPIGTPVQFTFELTAGAYSAVLPVTLKVGIVLEDWETGDFTSFPWTSGGNVPWTITTGSPYEGSYTARSGVITDNQRSEMILTAYILTDDSISFSRKVSCEAGSGEEWDYLEFLLDGERQGFWDGIQDWEEVTFAVPAGYHTFKWAYVKDGYASEGEDCAWVDYIVMPIMDESGNNVPEFTSTPQTVASVGGPYSYNITVTDDDIDDVLTIACPTLPSWLTFSYSGGNTATLSGTPSTGDIGNHPVVLTVADDIATIPQAFSISVGAVIENWESNSFSTNGWSTSGTAPWTIVTGNPYEGNFVARSGVINFNQVSTLQITLDVLTSDIVSFYKKVSSFASVDFLSFYIDGALQEEWSGEIDWSFEQYPVTSGSHTFKWEYSRNWYYGSGDDCGWIDYIVLPANSTITDISSSVKTAGSNELEVFPNPVTANATITYCLEEAAPVRISLHNLLGEEISVLNDKKNTDAGNYTLHFSTDGLSPGIYLCMMTVAKNVIIRRIVVAEK
ncbi:MAG: T9SS type A sorting domain-containing protein, partial [Bacteroidetes bacterium]|nr:T9SS type A sorting domain-containing protein [Bacteroidota bacterium]